MQEDGQQDQAGVQHEAEHGHQEHSGAEGAVLERAQVHDRMLRLQLAYHQGHQPEDAKRSPPADLSTAEPVFALSGVEHDLQHAEAQRQETDPPEIHATSLVLADVVRVMDEGANHHYRDGPDRKIEIENPAPGVVVGDPAAQRGTEDRRENDAQAECGHRRAVPLRRESLQQDGLGKRLQSAAGQALQNAEKDEPLQACGHSAQQGSEGKARDAGHQDAPTPEAVRQPARHRQDDGVRHQIRGDNPSAFLHRRAHVSRDVRYGDVHHRGVEDLHERAQHDSDCHDPGIHGLRGGVRHLPFFHNSKNAGSQKDVTKNTRNWLISHGRLTEATSFALQCISEDWVMGTTMVHIRIDQKVKQRAAKTLEAMGISISDAVRMLLVRAAAEETCRR